MPSPTDLFPLIRSLQNANIPRDTKNVYSFSIYYQSIQLMISKDREIDWIGILWGMRKI